MARPVRVQVHAWKAWLVSVSLSVSVPNPVALFTLYSSFLWRYAVLLLLLLFLGAPA